MTPFEHLSVLISIVLGLGMAHLLWSLHRVVEAREHVRLYWLSVAWAALIFIAQAEWWWSSYALQKEVINWTFFYFLFVLASPVTLYLASAFAFPEIEKGVSYDLRTYYYESRRWFCGARAGARSCAPRDRCRLIQRLRRCQQCPVGRYGWIARLQ